MFTGAVLMVMGLSIYAVLLKDSSMYGMLSGAWRYRFFIFSSVRTELRTKFVRSKLGGLWMILNPLAQVLIFAFVLSSVLSSKLPGIDNRYAYAIYLMAGTLGWTLFSEIVNRSMMVFIDNGNIIKKLSFPKIALPCIVIGSALVNNALLFIAMQAIYGVLGHTPGAAMVWLPLLTLVTVAFSVGLGLALGVLNVFVRDVGQVVPVVMQFIYWFTPIVYMANIIPKDYQGVLAWNPLIPIVTSYQDVLLYNRMPDIDGLIRTTLISAVLLILALVLFRKASPEMVDQL